MINKKRLLIYAEWVPDDWQAEIEAHLNDICAYVKKEQARKIDFKKEGAVVDNA